MSNHVPPVKPWSGPDVEREHDEVEEKRSVERDYDEIWRLVEFAAAARVRGASRAARAILSTACGMAQAAEWAGWHREDPKRQLARALGMLVECLQPPR